MIKSIRNLIGTSGEWDEARTFVVPNGEIALERRDNGVILVKVGDGVTRYEDLRYINRQNLFSQCSNIITLEDGAIHSIRFANYVRITFPLEAMDDFNAEVSFYTGADAADVEFSNSMPRLSGDDVADGVFLPKPNKFYTIWFWRDVYWNGVVRGVPNE